MKKQLIWFLVNLSVVSAFLIAGANSSGKGRADDTSEFKSLISRYWAAWSTLNADKAAPFYAKDADLVFFDVAPLSYQGWSAYRSGAQKGLLDTTAQLKVASRGDLKVTRHGDIAWTTGTFHLTITPREGNATDTDIRHTAIWEKRGGRWLIVHEHVSTPMVP